MAFVGYPTEPSRPIDGIFRLFMLTVMSVTPCTYKSDQSCCQPRTELDSKPPCQPNSQVAMKLRLVLVH